MSGLQWYPKNVSLFPPFYSFSYFFLISIPNVNCFLDQFTQQFINVIATYNDLLMDELNLIYFAPKLWLYVIIWLPRTTDNSTYFAQSLEIRGIESRLYMCSETLLIFLVCTLLCLIILRALTRILKTGVQDSHLAKSRSPTGKSGSPTQKKLESHQFVHTVYLFHFSWK